MNIKQTISNDELRIKIFKALADQTRLNTIRTLKASWQPIPYSELATTMKCGKSTASYHLKLLSEAGLITLKKVGQAKFVSLNREVFDGVLPGFLKTL
ncbi:ArsR/SmtB family transcription factor [Lacticaseibacillus songhuajiangensis]|jgi:DNA-binding transcriptional ArsR family regulator|uniref:ArsR/SmtB family transcription factor n=1 Tax=Lacticaseibacillus songhuajiangensis TaxID=1296539 RepID=UPI000F7A3088|nr:metalloregulator ArsR/SmtB family transcription factor [Lacticaseibacillus songhuajiangensis]MCI1283176.1 metalloregulator ArsR/SmtB family transcription factor [Lacticaseibacillus songhuajiangensis]